MISEYELTVPRSSSFFEAEFGEELVVWNCTYTSSGRTRANQREATFGPLKSNSHQRRHRIFLLCTRKRPNLTVLNHGIEPFVCLTPMEVGYPLVSVKQWPFRSESEFRCVFVWTLMVLRECGCRSNDRDGGVRSRASVHRSILQAIHTPCT